MDAPVPFEEEVASSRRKHSPTDSEFYEYYIAGAEDESSSLLTLSLAVSDWSWGELAVVVVNRIRSLGASSFPRPLAFAGGATPAAF